MTQPSGSAKEASEKSSKSMTERILQLVTLVAGLVGLPVAILQGRPASVVAVLVFAAACLGLLVAHVWRARLSSGQYRYSWQRWAAVTVAVAIIAILATININTTSRSIFLYDLLGFHRQSNFELAIAESAKYYRIQIPVSNDLAQSDQLDAVTVTIDWNASLGVGCLAFPVYYGLSDHVTLTKSGNLVGASVKASSGGFTGFMLQASGSLHEYCTSGKLTFTFDPGLIIEPNSTALIYVDVPKLINATHVQMRPEARPIVKNGHIVADATWIPINGPTLRMGGESALVISSNVKSVSGKENSFCRMIIHGSPVFPAAPYYDPFGTGVQVPLKCPAP